MKANDLVKIFGTAVVSQILAFLNAVFQPFDGTIFVFDAWQPIASKSAVGVGFVAVLVMTALYQKWKEPVSGRAIIVAAGLSGLLFVACGGTYVLLSSGYAPSTEFLFWVRDILWMLLYIAMLVMVGITVALVFLSLFGEKSPGRTSTSKPKADKKTKGKADTTPKRDPDPKR
jgi:hypothetical protein